MSFVDQYSVDLQFSKILVGNIEEYASSSDVVLPQRSSGLVVWPNLKAVINNLLEVLVILNNNRYQRPDSHLH